MAFPTTGVLDDFTRADAATLGANWTANPTGSAGRHRVASNQAKRETGTANTADYYSVNTYGPDCECYVTMDVLAPDDWGGTISGGIFVRLVNPGAGTADGYRHSFRGSDSHTLFRYDNGTATALGADFSVSGADGDSFGLEAVGSTIKAYHKPSAGSWTEVASRTDGTYSAAGFLALAMFDGSDNLRFDDFGGGTIPAGGPNQRFMWMP